MRALDSVPVADRFNSSPTHTTSYVSLVTNDVSLRKGMYRYIVAATFVVVVVMALNRCRRGKVAFNTFHGRHKGAAGGRHRGQGSADNDRVWGARLGGQLLLRPGGGLGAGPFSWEYRGLRLNVFSASSFL